jgi:hypothetical protein
LVQGHELGFTAINCGGSLPHCLQRCPCKCTQRRTRHMQPRVTQPMPNSWCQVLFKGTRVSSNNCVCSNNTRHYPRVLGNWAHLQITGGWNHCTRLHKVRLAGTLTTSACAEDTALWVSCTGHQQHRPPTPGMSQVSQPLQSLIHLQSLNQLRPQDATTLCFQVDCRSPLEITSCRCPPMYSITTCQQQHQRPCQSNTPSTITGTQTSSGSAKLACETI